MKVASSIQIPVKITNGKFASNLNLIKQILEHYEGHTIDVTFKKRSNKRSNQQNKYYFSCIVPIFQNAIKEEWAELWSIERVHEFLLTNCNYEELVNEKTGEVLRRTKRSTENTTTEAETFYERCRTLAKDFFNTEIPLPNEEITLEF